MAAPQFKQPPKSLGHCNQSRTISNLPAANLATKHGSLSIVDYSLGNKAYPFRSTEFGVKMNFLETLWSIIIFFLFLSYLILLFQIVADLFRDSKLSGWMKVLWIIGLVVLPFLTALVYIIVRGQGMTERSIAQINQAQKETEEYVRRVAHTQSPAEQIAAAKALLDAETITEDEYAQLKAKALV